MNKINIEFIANNKEDWQSKFIALKNLNQEYQIKFIQGKGYDVANLLNSKPDILIIPLTLPGLKSIEIIRSILYDRIPTKVMLLSNTTVDDQKIILNLFDGYLRADSCNIRTVDNEIKKLIKKEERANISLEEIENRIDRLIMHSNTFSIDGGYFKHKGNSYASLISKSLTKSEKIKQSIILFGIISSLLLSLFIALMEALVAFGFFNSNDKYLIYIMLVFVLPSITIYSILHKKSEFENIKKWELAFYIANILLLVIFLFSK